MSSHDIVNLSVVSLKDVEGYPLSVVDPRSNFLLPHTYPVKLRPDRGRVDRDQFNRAARYLQPNMDESFPVQLSRAYSSQGHI